jgi:indole-3-glycerol phosphate synthase
MNGTFLQTVTGKARARAALLRANGDLAALKRSAEAQRSIAEPFRLQKALRGDGINIIAEIKRASPSKGVINSDVDPAQLAAEYQVGGAAAISVLTEEEYFKGSLDDLRVVRSSVTLPILRKDFIVDEIQIIEAAAAAADAILLIVAVLNSTKLADLYRITAELGMDALVEVHSAAEMQIAAELGAAVVGINNRDLKSLEVTLDTSRALINNRPKGALMVAESGVSSAGDLRELRQLGFDGFLIGEALMRNSDPRGTLRTWI